MGTYMARVTRSGTFVGPSLVADEWSRRSFAMERQHD